MPDYMMDPKLTTGAETGLSWEDAYRTYGDLLSGKGASDRGFIKAGYLRNTAGYTIPAGFELYGGYSPYLEGTDGIDIDTSDDRNLEVYKTIFDGQGLYRAFGIGGDYVVIDGFTFLNCYYSGNGGALDIDGPDYWTIGKCVFRGCRANQGGAIRIDSCTSGTISDCTFGLNTAIYGVGGALYFYENSSVEIVDTRFSGCVAYTYGGAMHISGGNNNIVDVTNCVIDHCEASNASGGGVYCPSGSTVKITGTTIDRCIADGEGGGVFAVDDEGSDSYIKNSIVRNCTAGTGNNNVYEDGSNPVLVAYSNLGGGEFSGSTGVINAIVPYRETGAHPYDVIETYAGNDKADSTATNYSSTDIRGRSRYDDASESDTDAEQADMGAYEYQGQDVETKSMDYTRYALRLYGVGTSSVSAGPMTIYAVVRIPDSPAAWQSTLSDGFPMSAHILGDVLIEESDSTLTERVYMGSQVVKRETASAAVDPPSWEEDWVTLDQGDETYEGDSKWPRVYNFRGGEFGRIRYAVVRIEFDYEIDTNSDVIMVFNYQFVPYHSNSSITATTYKARLSMHDAAALKYAPDMDVSAWHIYQLQQSLNKIMYEAFSTINLPVFGKFGNGAIIV